MDLVRSRVMGCHGEHARSSISHFGYLIDSPLFWVTVGGAVGASLRYAFTLCMPIAPGEFPWGTLWENVLGAFLLGLVMTMLLDRLPPIRHLQPFLCTGVLGSFTTFSNFSVEIVQLMQSGRQWLALTYAFGSVAAGITAALLGIIVARCGSRRISSGPRSHKLTKQQEQSDED